MLFQEEQFLDRFKSAAEHGFKGIEILFPYEVAPEAILEGLKKYDLKLVLINTPPGNWGGGDRGLACDPSRKNEFQDSVESAITYAKLLNCGKVHCMAGLKPEQTDTEIIYRTYVENLIFAATKMQDYGIDVLIEAINKYDMPNYFLKYSSDGFKIIGDLGLANLLFQYDVYHMQIMEGNLATTIRDNIEKIGHFQIADVPGRNEPGTGEINYDFLLRYINDLGYDNWIGCEYTPLKETKEGLSWIEKYLHH